MVKNSHSINKPCLSPLLFVLLLLSSMVSQAQVEVASGKGAAGFRLADSAEPVIELKYVIDMLAVTGDVASMQVFADGRVLVHQPAYMKKAGDYEMQLSQAELVALIRDLSSQGAMDFDAKAMRENIRLEKRKLTSRGELYEVSDAMETVVQIKMAEYQKDNKSKALKPFAKTFRWKNLKQDAKRFKNNVAIGKANKTVSTLNSLMHDSRLNLRPNKGTK